MSPISRIPTPRIYHPGAPMALSGMGEMTGCRVALHSLMVVAVAQRERQPLCGARRGVRSLSIGVEKPTE